MESFGSSMATAACSQCPFACLSSPVCKLQQLRSPGSLQAATMINRKTLMLLFSAALHTRRICSLLVTWLASKKKKEKYLIALPQLLWPAEACLELVGSGGSHQDALVLSTKGFGCGKQLVLGFSLLGETSGCWQQQMLWLLLQWEPVGTQRLWWKCTEKSRKFSLLLGDFLLPTGCELNGLDCKFICQP